MDHANLELKIEGSQKVFPIITPRRNSKKLEVILSIGFELVKFLYLG